MLLCLSRLMSRPVTRIRRRLILWFFGIRSLMVCILTTCVMMKVVCRRIVRNTLLVSISVVCVLIIDTVFGWEFDKVLGMSSAYCTPSKISGV